MRLFLAIDLPAAIKKTIATRIEKLKKAYSRYRWVPEENYHITLYFFGETNKLEKIKKKIEKVVWEINSFYMFSRGLDIFSNKNHIIYLGFYRQKEIENLAKKLKLIFDPQNKNNQQFIPHLTLARGRRSSVQQYFALSKKLRSVKINIHFPVTEIILFESILTPTKPVYRKIAVFPLSQSF